jgi:hypothetical protein
MVEYCTICGINELLSLEEKRTGVCTDCSLSKVDDAMSDSSQLFDF